MNGKDKLEISPEPSAGKAARLGQPRLLREVNARRILHLLRDHGPCSRADLARYSGLSAPTISNTIAYLQTNNLIEAVGLGPSKGGRPPDLLRFNTKAGYVIGVDIGTALVRIALRDLDGKIVEKHVLPTSRHSTPARVVSLIATGVRKLQSDHKIASRKLLAIAAGVPGITDAQKGVVLSAPILPSLWRNVPLQQTLESKTGIPTSLDNDVNLAALGEGWCGRARGVKNFVFLTIGTGIGAGIVINGRLYHGADWAAGEIGYLYVPGIEEAPLAMLRPGSLESITGAAGIEHVWQKLCDKGQQRTSRKFGRIDAAKIFDIAEKGNSQAEKVLQHTARILSDAITNLCLVLNPSLVIMGGRVGSSPALFNAICGIIERNEFCRPQLAVSALASNASLLGAVRLALATAEQKILPEEYPLHPRPEAPAGGITHSHL